MKPTFQGEVMLLGWSESHNGGAKVTFQLADPSDLEPFKAMTVAKGKTAGQRLACVLVEIGEDEQPIQADMQKCMTEEKAKGGPLAKLAGMWCNDPKFWAWINRTGGWGSTVRTPEAAAEWMRFVCFIDSRAQLDNEPDAADTFHRLIREPYSAYLKTLEATA